MDVPNSKRARAEMKKRSQHPINNSMPQFSTSCPCLPPVASITTHLTNTSSIASTSALPQTVLPASTNEEEMAQFDQLNLSRDEIIASLRAFRQPATLCGEDDAMRLLRWKTLLKSGALNMTVAELITHGKYLYPLSLGGMEKYERFRMPQCGSRSKQERGKVDCDVCAGDPNNMDVTAILTLDTDTEHARMKLTFDTLCEEYKIMVFFKQLLREWWNELDKRPHSEKSTSKWHSLFTIYEQSVHVMAPLLKMCKERTVPADIKQPLLMIVERCLQRDYLSAIDEYTKLVFAKAPPSEEHTMVEIQEHSRTDNVTMNDVETLQRRDNEMTKFLLCVRRLMTLCQRLYPWRPSNSTVNKHGTITAPQALMFAKHCLRMWKDGFIKL